MSSLNLTNIEIDAIKLPQLNSIKLFSPELLFTEKDEIASLTNNKLEEERQSKNSEDNEEENEEEVERGVGGKGEKKENKRGAERKEGARKIKEELKNWMETSSRGKKSKKMKKNIEQHLRKESDFAQVVEKNSSESFKHSQSQKKNKNALHFLRIIKNIASAINKLRARSKFRPLKFFFNNHFEVLNDKSNFFDSSGKGDDHLKMLLAKNEMMRMIYKWKIWSKKTRIYLICAEKIKQLGVIFEEKIPVLHPDHVLKIIWDFFIILIFLFLFFSYPIQMSFQLSHLWIEYYLGFEKNIIEIFIVILYGMNCLMKLNQAFYDKGMLVVKRSLILKNYIKNELFCDILGSIPISIELFISLNPYYSFLLDIRSYVEILFFFKIFEVKKITRFLEETLHLNDKYFAFFQLFKLMITLLLFLNIMSCLWHAISFYSPFPKNMMQSSNYNTKDWQSRYLKTLFWTVNPGRIDPQNDLELFFGFFALLGTSGSMGFLISGIHNLMRILGKNAEEKRENMRKLNLYMQNKKIDFDLQGKVRKYVNYLQEISTADSEIEKDLINKLNPSLKEELLIRANGRIIKNLPFFSRNFSEKTLRKLVFAMKPNRFYPEELICEEGEEEQEKKLYLISDGEVRLLKSDSQIKLATLEKGDMFGLYDILSDSKGHYQSVISLGFSSIYTITNSELIRILKENPIDYENFCFIKDKFLWEKNLELTYLRCYACNLKSHFIMNCPRLHYQPDPSFILLKHLYSSPMEQRVPFNEKRRKKKFNARGSFAYLLKRILRFNVDFEEVINNMDGGANPFEDDFEEELEDSIDFQCSNSSMIEETLGENEEGRGGVKSKREEGRERKEERGGGLAGGEGRGIRRESILGGTEDGGIGGSGFKRRASKLKTGESLYEGLEDGSWNGRKRTSKLTQNLGESIYEEREDGGRGGTRKRTRKFIQNGCDIVHEEKPFLERKEKSKNTLNYSEKFCSETMIATSEAIEKIESKTVKIYSKEEHVIVNRFDKLKTYSIYYPEYNIENVIDFINSKRRMRSSKKKKNNFTSTEILTSPLSPIQQHQKERKTNNSDLRAYSFLRAVSLKKTHTFLAEN